MAGLREKVDQRGAADPPACSAQCEHVVDETGGLAGNIENPYETDDQYGGTMGTVLVIGGGAAGMAAAIAAASCTRLCAV